jgi:transcriptional regulator with PAS, ATPase and Fis domain
LIERAINLAGDDPLLRAEHFDLAVPGCDRNVSLPAEAAPLLPLVEVEREMICRAVAHYKHNIHKAAMSLGISRNTLYRKMKEYGFGDDGSGALESVAATRPN